MAKASTCVPLGILLPLPVPQYVFEHASLDLIIHLPVTAHGHNSIPTIINWLSKLVYFIPCKEAITAEEMAQLFLSVVVA